MNKQNTDIILDYDGTADADAILSSKVFASGPFTFSTKEGSTSGHGRLRIDNSANRHIVIEFRPNEVADSGILFDAFSKNLKQEISFEFGGFEYSSDVFITNANIFPDGDYTLLIKKEPLQIGSTDASVRQIDFCLANIDNRRLPQRNYTFGQKHESLGGDEISTGEWTITLGAVEDAQEKFQQAKSGAILSITNECRITRADGTDFRLSDGRQVANRFCDFVSFACGVGRPPILLTATEENGDIQYVELGSGSSVLREGLWNWASRHQIGSNETLFHRFLKLFDDQENGASWYEVLGWYLQTNATSADLRLRIIGAIAALEKLSWIVLVNTDKTVTLSDFNKLSTAAAIRLLLAHMRLPLSIPTEMESHVQPLIDKLARNGPVDLPALICSVRNEFVHPKERLGEIGGDAAFSVLLACLWAIETVILRAIGFAGEYCDRRAWPGWHGKTSPFPKAETA